MYRSDHNQSEDISILMGQLLAMHKEHGVVIGKDSKSNRNTYATLPGILSQIQKMLSPYGIILTEGVDGGYERGTIFTRLDHPESGQWKCIESTLTPKSITVLPDYIVARMDQSQWNGYCSALLNSNPDQAWGGSTTYHRRYNALMICGLAAADDPTDFNEGHTDVIPEAKQTMSQNVAMITNEFISEKQCGLLRAKLNGNKELADKILEQFKFPNLTNIPWRKFNDVLAFIDDYKEQ